MSETTVFGMPSETSVEGLEVDDEPIEETPAPEGEQPPEPEAPEAPAPAPEAEATEEEGEQPEGEEQPAPEGYQFAGRFFTSQDEAERAYREMQGLQSRTVEQERQVRAQWEAERQQMAAFLQQVAPVLEQARQQPQAAPVRVPGPGDADFDPENAQQVQAFIDSRVQAGTQQAAQALQQQFDQRLQQTLSPLQQQQAQMIAAQQAAMASQELESYETEIEGFRQEHPEVTVGSVTEQAVANVLQPLRAISVMPTQQMLTMALDATRSPALMQEIAAEAMQVERILRMNPSIPPTAVESLFDSDEGLNTLYRRANLAPQGTRGAQGARSPQDTAGRRPHVETGGSGAPVDTAPGRTPDELDTEFDKYQRERTEASPFFGGGLRT